MQEFHSSVDIKGQLDHVFELAKEIYFHPESLPDVRSIDIVERSGDGNRVISEWAGIVREFRVIIKWTAEDIWDDKTNTCAFSVVKGDYGKYSGLLTFTDAGGTTRLDGNVKAECDIRKFGSSIERFVARKMKKNVDSMFEFIRARAENSVATSV